MVASEPLALFIRWRSRHPLVFFVARRLIALVLLCLGMTVIGFVLTHLVPGDPVAANLGERAAADPAIVQSYRERYGLDQPLIVQYGIYLNKLVHGDMGTSELSGQPVLHELAVFVPATAELALTSMVLACAIGIPLGVIAALNRDSWLDHLLRLVSLSGMSVPQFWLALIALYIFFFKLGIVPGTGRLNAIDPAPPHVTGLFTVDALIVGQMGTFVDAVEHLVLPAAVLAVFSLGLFTRFTRSSVLEVLENDYVRTARAKGLPARIVVFRHVARPAIAPVVTIVGLAFGNVMTGTVLVESIFSWPGIGQFSYISSTSLDLPAIVGVMLFVGFVYIAINLAVDVLYGVIDPRLKVR